MPGGSRQEAIADAVSELVEVGRENRADRTSTAIDVSACGLPFMRLLRERRVRAAAVVVGDAVRPRADDRIWHVPARELIAITLGLLTGKRLAVAELEYAPPRSRS